MAAKGKFMDALHGLASESDSEDDDASDQPESPKKKAKVEVTLDQLEKNGYKGGLSVLHVKPAKADSEFELKWSDGRAAKEQEEEETIQDREHTRKAATEAVSASAAFSQKAVAQAAKLAEAKKLEKAAKYEERSLTFNQKEKRKRDAGQASRGKNFVEEEKRQARGFGVFSGFD